MHGGSLAEAKGMVRNQGQNRSSKPRCTEGKVPLSATLACAHRNGRYG